jgi:hypothetical protein
MSLPSSYRSRRGHIHLPWVLPLVGCQSKTQTVRTSGRRQGHLGGDSQRHLQQSRVLSDTSEQSFLASILLAHNSDRCRRTHQKMPRVSILHQAATRPCQQASHDTANLVVHLLGARHDWASTYYARGFNRVLVAIDKFTK